MSERVKLYFRLAIDDDGYPPAAVESVWATPTATPGQYVIDNIPFFVCDATLGDTVCAHLDDGQLWFDRLVEDSANSLVRVAFHDLASFTRINTHLVALGCGTEYAERYRLLAVSIPGHVALKPVQEHLQREMDAEIIDYEEPILRHDP